MIPLRFVKVYRSISELPSVDLPDFTIITGINGSGKSQLLEAIENESVKAEGLTRANSNQVRRFDWNTLVPKTENPVDPVFLVRNRSALITSTVEKLSQVKNSIVRDIINLKIEGLPVNSEQALLNLDEVSFKKLVGDNPAIVKHWPRVEQTLRKALHNNFVSLRGNFPNSNFLAYLQQVLKVQETALLFLSADEIDKLVPLDWTPVDIFQHNLSEVFATYHRAWEENLQHDFYNHKYSENYPVFSRLEFQKYFGSPPWEFLNQILETAGLDFKATHPTGRADLMFQVKLKNQTTGVEVLFSDLSSGEKIIMSFALCLYHAQRKASDAGYPKLLLFDEIDAPLHPSMTKGLVSVIDDILIKQKGVKVILTTHSPATVAFAPEGALYRLEKHPRKLVPSTKDEAIQTLTSGYISVTQSSRIVIAEAQQDKMFYTGLFKKLVERKKLAVSPNLVFVQAGDKKDQTAGGREQVKIWSKKLSEAGLSHVFGLIDRDEGNAATQYVKVLQRYSIENYFLDPINVYAHLMHERKHEAVLDIGIKDYDYHQLRNASEENLQKIADKICQLVEKQHPDLGRNSKNPFGVEYICGKKITLPGWMRDHRGHNLEELCRQCFQDLFDKDFILTKDESGCLTSMLTDRLPDFIPLELVDTLKELQ
jgi:predicted ATPase